MFKAVLAVVFFVLLLQLTTEANMHVFGFIAAVTVLGHDLAGPAGVLFAWIFVLALAKGLHDDKDFAATCAGWSLGGWMGNTAAGWAQGFANLFGKSMSTEFHKGVLRMRFTIFVCSFVEHAAALFGWQRQQGDVTKN